jgi:hypothetical protein
MSAVKDLYYDIESLFIEGYSAVSISVQLGCPLDQVYAVLDTFGVSKEDAGTEDEPYSPYYGA